MSRNTENLKEPWAKGQSGNPNGRPKLEQHEKDARAAVRQMVDKHADKPLTAMLKMVQDHESGVKPLQGRTYTQLLQYLNDWMNGKAAQTFDLKSSDRSMSPGPDLSKLSTEALRELRGAFEIGD